MAKRKLTEAQREKIRKDIRRGLSAGTSQADLMRAMSKKYSISTETVRWYLKSGKNGSASAAAKKAKGAKRRPTAKPSRRVSRAPRVKHATNGHAGGLLGFVKSVSESALRRALAAKKLLPHLDAHLARKLELARVVREAKKSLRAIESKARKIRRKIARLISG
jgi:hypothetical protein